MSEETRKVVKNIIERASILATHIDMIGAGYVESIIEDETGLGEGFSDAWTDLHKALLKYKEAGELD